MENSISLRSIISRTSWTWEPVPEFGPCVLPFTAHAIAFTYRNRDMADAHPEATIKGIDLSPIQPSWIPPNLKFEVDDYNLEWLDHNKFDLIHARELLGTVPSWPEMYRKVLG